MAKKRKKGNKVIIVLILVVLLVIVGVGGYGYIKYNPLVQEKKDEIYSIENYLLNSEDFPKTVTKDMSFPTALDDFEGITLIWESSDEDTISNLGHVSFPNYLDGDKRVKVTVSYVVNSQDSLFNIFWNFLGINHQTVLEFVIEAKDASPLEKIEIVEAGLVVPSYTNCNIGLLQKDEIFSSVDIVWESSNLDIMTNNGEKKGTGEVRLKATLTCESETKVIEYTVIVGDDLPSLTDTNVSFDNHSKSSYNGEYEKDGFVFVNTIFSQDEEQEDLPGDSLLENFDKVVRFKASSSASAYFYSTYGVINPQSLSFRYGLVNSDKGKINKASHLIVYYSNDNGKNWIELSNDLLVSDKVDYNKTLDLQGEIYFKVELTTEYAEIRMDLDDFLVTRSINSKDIEESLTKNFSTKFSNSRLLPLTTIYGGVITWTSNNNDVLSSSGKVVRANETKKVILQATITGFNEEIKVTFEITIPGKGATLPVEIFFIDLGKYGLSDCGESTYIKYGNIDILVDAGDEIKTSFRAVQEVIDANSEDKVLDYVVATHPDSDHIGGMPFIFSTYEIKYLIQFEGSHTSNLYQKYVDAYKNEDCTVCGALDSYNNTNNCQRIIELGNEVYLEIINTQNYDGKETNTRSVVSVLNAYGVRVLLTGDADNGSNSHLESDYMNSVGNIDILKIVHHGTKEGTTIPFLEAVDPEVVVVCNGNYLGNKHGHPSPNAVNRIYQYDNNIDIYAIVGGDSQECEATSSGSYKCEVEDATVDRNGTIKIVIDGNGYDISSEYYQDNPLEFSNTYYWKNNSMREYSHK